MEPPVAEGKTPARIPTHMASAFTSYTLPDGSGEEVIRGDVKDVEELTKRIEAKGYKVVHVAQIG